MSEQDRAFFAVVTPGLEFVSEAELKALGATEVEIVAPGGVAFQGPVTLGMQVNLCARTVGRVLLRVTAFKATSFPQLFKRARAVDWEPYLVEGAGVEVKAAARRSRLIHTGRIATTLTEAVAKSRGGNGGAEVGTTVYARFEDDVCTLSVDLSGELLHKRGYRVDVGRAPLRETMAAALLTASGYTGDEPLVNLACGSGSLAIEGAMMALGHLPGAARHFAAEAWPITVGAGWGAVREALEAAAAARHGAGGAPRVLASDRDPAILEAARQNAEAAGCGDAITFEARDVAQTTVPDGAGLVVCNPPWGQRIGSQASLRPFYGQLGASLARFTGWRAAVLSTDKVLRTTMEQAMERGPSQVRRYRQGGLDVTWTLYHIKAP